MGAKAGDTAVSLGTDGLHNGGNKITNVVAGTADTDAINVSQLKQTVKDGTTKLTDGVNTKVTSTTWEVGKTAAVHGRGATEDQLKVVSEAAKDAKDLAQQHSTVTVNHGSAAGSLVMNTSTNSNGGTNYDIALDDNISVGGTNGKDGSIGVNGKDGSNGVTISSHDGKDGHIGLNGKDGSTADIHGAGHYAGQGAEEQQGIL